MPVPALLAISNDEQVRPAAPMSWMPTIASVAHQLEARLDQALLGEGIADLHRRAASPRSSSSNSADASRLAPWMPSRPVLLPT